MAEPLPEAALDQPFRNARTQNGFLDRPVPSPDAAAIGGAFSADSRGVRSNFIATLGYGDPPAIFVRTRRPDFGTFNALNILG